MNDIELIKDFPVNLWDKYSDRLTKYSSQKEELQNFIKEKLIEGVDYGKTDESAKKNTLMKSGAEKIQDLMECKIKLYPDIDSWKMLGGIQGTVCYVGYIIDQQILYMLLKYLATVNINQNEQQIIKLFAWGEGRGACSIYEKVYSDRYPKLVGKPLKGSENRTIKMAEKRCKVDAVISTFGLDFSQDDEYGKDGRLKGDSFGMKKTPEQEEMKGFYSAILRELQMKENNENLFTKEELMNYKKTLDNIKNKLEDLKKFYNIINKLKLERIERIRHDNKTV